MKNKFLYSFYYLFTFIIYSFLYLVDVPLKATRKTRKFMKLYFTERASGEGKFIHN